MSENSETEFAVVLSNFISRADLRANRDALFVFGDNVKERGFGGQAKEMRGEPNAVGIPTKWKPAMDEAAFFSDSDLPAIRGLIDERFEELMRHRASGGKIVWPALGVGTGLADLPNRAPRVWDYIESKRRALFDHSVTELT